MAKLFCFIPWKALINLTITELRKMRTQAWCWALLWAGDGKLIHVGRHWSLISSLFLPHFYLTCRMKMILTSKLILNLRIKCAVQKSWILLPLKMAIQLLKNQTALYILFIGKNRGKNNVLSNSYFPAELFYVSQWGSLGFSCSALGDKIK